MSGRPSENPLLDVPLHTFVRVWQTSDSVREVLERLGLENLDNKDASTRASWLRSRGVDLGKMRPQHKKQYPDNMIKQLSRYSDWIHRVQENGNEDLYEDLSFETFQALNGQQQGDTF